MANNRNGVFSSNLYHNRLFGISAIDLIFLFFVNIINHST